MRKLTIKEKTNGELAVRNFCKEAYEAYSGIDPLTVAECWDGTYSIRGTLGDIDGLTFEELEEIFVDWAKEFETED